jgi:mono/diheme cytochrome c family protein
MKVTKSGSFFLLGAIVVCLAAATLFALSGSTTTAQSKSGKDLYKQNCRVCHEKASPNGEFSPMSLTQDQWKKFFDSKLVPAHKQVTLPGMNQKLFEMLTPEQLKTIQKFAVDHAADSEQPQTCSGE